MRRTDPFANNSSGFSFSTTFGFGNGFPGDSNSNRYLRVVSCDYHVPLLNNGHVVVYTSLKIAL